MFVAEETESFPLSVFFLLFKRKRKAGRRKGWEEEKEGKGIEEIRRRRGKGGRNF